MRPRTWTGRGLSPGDGVAAAAVLALGALALLHGALASRRPPPTDLRAETVIEVTRGSDGGSGSLREAILAADRASGKVRLALAVPRVVLADPLPALLNPAGVVIDGGDSGCEIDAGSMLGGPVFDLAAPAVLHRLVIRGAPGAAVLVRAGAVRLKDLTVVDSSEGVVVLPAAGGLEIRDSVFRANGVGVRLLGDSPGTVIRGNLFEDHTDAGLWSVRRSAAEAAAGFAVRGNRFVGGRVAMVLGNTVAEVSDNHVERASETGIYLLGRGAVLRGNRIHGGALFGIHAVGLTGALVVRNEIDHNRAAGILVQDAASSVFRANRLHANGYGMVAVRGAAAGAGPGEENRIIENLFLTHRQDAILAIGDSPVVERNRALGNRRAALRLIDYAHENRPVRIPQPRLAGNVFAGNGADAPVRGGDAEARAQGAAPGL